MIKKICFSDEGCVHCKSNFYTCYDVLQSSMKFEFSTGINILEGEIDSGIFGISYLISMYNDTCAKTFMAPPVALVDGVEMPLKELTNKACYLDHIHNPLFSKRISTRKLVEKGLKKSHLPYTANEICAIFRMEDFRFDRPVSATGNEKFKAMAAVGFAFGKEIFCFPWLSKMRFESFNNHLPQLFDVLEHLEKIVIMPRGR